MFAVKAQLKRRKIGGSFSVEVDLIIDEHRVVKGDSCFMTPDDRKRQAVEAAKWGQPDPTRARIYVPPTIVIESVSPGHRAHDRVTKFAWYAEFGVKHFLSVDAFRRTLDACVLQRGKHKQVAALARDGRSFGPAAFAGPRVAMRDVWPAQD